MMSALSTNSSSRLWHRTVTIHHAVQAGGAAFRFSQPIFPSSGGALGASKLIQSTQVAWPSPPSGSSPPGLNFSQVPLQIPATCKSRRLA